VSDPREFIPDTPRVVGRDAELRAVSSALEDLAGGTGGFLQIVGEPGIGKTHLLGALRELAARKGITARSGRAAEFEQRIAFQILLDALHGYGERVRLEALVPPATAEVLLSALPGLRGAGADADPLPAAPAAEAAQDVDRFKLFRALRELLVAMASEPLVVVLDDVHWADPGSIDFIAYLSRRPIPEPVLVVVAYRDRQAPAQLRYALARDADHGAVTRIEVGPLSRADSARLLGHRPGSRHAADLYARSQGNPLYLLALDRSDGHGHGPGAGSGGGHGAGSDAAEWTAADRSSRLEALILGEIATLSPEALSAAGAAAVLGDPFSAEILAALLSDLTEEQLERALGELVGHDLIRPGSHGPMLVFRHPLVRRAVYDNVGPARRVGVHRRALALLTLHGWSAVERSRHIEHCVSSYSADHVAVLCQAGQESMSTSPLTAAHWFQVALWLLPRTEALAQQRFELGYRLARALVLGGRFAASRDLLHELLDTRAADDDADRSAAVVLCAHAEQRLGRYPEAIALLRAEVARLGETSSPERVGLCLELGLTAVLANDYAAARADITWARAAAHEAGDRLGEATALAFSAFGEVCVGHTAVARQAADAASRLVDGLPDSALSGEREALCMLGWAEMLLERFADAERHLARGHAIIRRTGQSHGLPHVLLGQSLVSMFTGRMAAALDFAQQAEDAAHLVGSDHLLGIVLAIKAPIQVWVSPLGEGDAALEAARRATALFTGSAVNSWWARNALMLRGHAELTNGDPRTCVELVLRGGGEDLRRLGAPLLAQYAEILVGALIKLDELAQAEEFAQHAASFALTLDLPGQSAHASRTVGLIKALHGDHEAALAAFAAADRGFAQVGKAVEEARTAVFAARSLFRLGRAEEASAALARCIAQADACGALWVRQELERVRDQFASGGVPRASPGRAAAATALAALTDREREVAVMLGAGRTNRQIASRLRLSERTVEAHLANAYRKLGVTSRVALAGLLAREQGHREVSR
jgi:DNA-binding CsgD family transcriptional regulator